MKDTRKIIVVVTLLALWLPRLGTAQIAGSVRDWYNKERATTERSVSVSEISNWLTTKFISNIGPAVRDIQSTRSEVASAAGSSAQSSALPSLEPIEMAGGTVSAVGNKSGAGVVTALTINPTVFVADTRDKSSLSNFAGLIRLVDFSVLVPVDNADRNGDGVVDYLGIRVRLNKNGLAAGTMVYEDVVSAYQDELNSYGKFEDALVAFLNKTDTDQQIKFVKAVLDGNFILARKIAAIQELDPTKDVALLDKIQKAREKADDSYFGLDLRADFGDLSLGGVDTLRGTSLYAGVGWGKRIVEIRKDAVFGIKAAVGWYYVSHVDSVTRLSTDSHSSLSGQIGIELVRFYEFQRLDLNCGFEFWKSWGIEKLAKDFTTLRASLNVPAGETSSFSVNIGLPLTSGGDKPSISIGGNWRLLWS